MKLGTFLLSLVEPIIGRILVALGFSVVSIVGVDAAINQVKSLVISNIGGMGAIMDFAMYIWIGKGLGIIFGAIATKLMLWQIQNATKIIGRNPG